MLQDEDRSLIIGNIVKHCANEGIQIVYSNQCIIAQNLLVDNQDGGTAIVITDSNASRITDNTIVANDHTVNVGIYGNSGSNNLLVTGNDLHNVEAEGIRLDGSENQVFGNTGWVTENSGIATIPEGSSMVTVAHGLDGTPTVVNALSQGPGVYSLYVDDTDDTNFTINADGVNILDDVDIYWEARIR